MHRSSTIEWYAQVLNAVEGYLENNYAEPFGIRQLAERAHLSYHHLGAIFQQSRGESLGTYLVRKKLEHSATLYAYTQMNLSEIADRTGYATKHSLSKAFTKNFGMSPRNFLKNSLYRPGSPNIVLDGFQSRKEYETMLTAEAAFEYRIETLHHCWMAGRLGPPSEKWEQAFEAQVTTDKTTARYFMKAFDSVNFSPLSSFRMLAGRFYSDIPSPELVNISRNQDEEQLILPVKDGRYVCFQVPPGPPLSRQRFITVCREQLVQQNKLFTLEDFYDFFLFPPSGAEHGGQYYMFLG